MPTNASPPPPGFGGLPKGHQFHVHQLPGHLHTEQAGSHPPKMLSVEELEARLMRQSQQPSPNVPSPQPPQLHHIQSQQPLHHTQSQQPQQAQLAILQQLQQLQHLQHMHQLQYQYQQMQQIPPQPDQNDHQHTIKAPSNTPGHTTQVYVRKNVANFQSNPRVTNDSNNNSNHNHNHTGYYNSNTSQKQPRGITLGDMLPTLKTGRVGQGVANGVTRGPRFERKLMMTSEEIETIIHMQHAQLHSNHPYTDDYYYYQLQKRRGSQPLTRDEPPDIVRHHKPLCESTPSRTFPPKKIINDPLAGSLGRIPSHNVRAPRTLLQLIATEMAETEDGNSNSITTEDRAELGVHQSLLLAVENAFNHLLDIEDIDLILSSSNGSVNVAHLLQKRDELSMDLFKSLNLDSYPLSKMNPPVPIPLPPFSLNSSATIPTSASINARIIPPVVQEDEFFVGIALISKGKKLLARAIPLFPPSIAVPVLLAFMRNFLFLLAHNEREKEKEKGSKMFVHLNFLIGGLATPHVLLAFHTLLLFHGEMAILKLLQYQESVDVILNFMRRGHELTRGEGGPNVAHWRGMFSELLTRVSFGRTLPPLLSRPFMWELVLAMAIDADDFQRSMIAENMKDNIFSHPHLDQLPSANTLRTLLNLYLYVLPPHTAFSSPS